eukprot:CAMPEP_0117480862 /NCGR_PEP_ID=MMETSP0784-20121206/12606_1 /TAXON_ID=39447 /ORGANISM="" /LENGTH=361 /DNA_ID=CAMNT_0005275307 /DNA_START=48 /DNA_END=1133 /DNA_ORIENTATION=-
MAATADEMSAPFDQTQEAASVSYASTAGPTTLAEKPKPKGKQLSVVGVALNNSLGSPLRLKSQGSDAEGQLFINPEVSSKIASKYSSNVRECEQERHMLYMPLDQQVIVHPCHRDLMSTIKSDLDTTVKDNEVCHKAASDLFASDDFLKRMGFLHTYAKTGQFIEKYGTQGHYEGEFLNGMRHGKGNHEFRGEVYDGEWKWDYRHGWGTLSLPDGSQVKGEWQCGKPHGFVSMMDRKGTIIYEGEFRTGKRHGLGRQLFESGDMYDGGWAEGKLHDRGVYYFTNGDKLYGMWNQGLYDGVGVFHYADGSVSRREYKAGVLQSVQDYEAASQRFGKTIHRNHMHMHTQSKDFPKDVFLMNTM